MSPMEGLTLFPYIFAGVVASMFTTVFTLVAFWKKRHGY